MYLRTVPQHLGKIEIFQGLFTNLGIFPERYKKSGHTFNIGREPWNPGTVFFKSQNRHLVTLQALTKICKTALIQDLANIVVSSYSMYLDPKWKRIIILLKEFFCEFFCQISGKSLFSWSDKFIWTWIQPLLSPSPWLNIQIVND